MPTGGLRVPGMDMRPLLEHEGPRGLAEAGLPISVGGGTPGWVLLPAAQTHHYRQSPSGPAEHTEGSQTGVSPMASPEVEP